LKRSTAPSTSTVSRLAKRASAEEHVDAELVAVAHGGVVVADLRADAAHALHRGAEVGLRARREREPDLLLRAARLRDHARRADHALRRHAADVQAVAAEQVALDERDLRAEPAPIAAVISPAVPPPITTRL
jgi:hypothetical protein